MAAGYTATSSGASSESVGNATCTPPDTRRTALRTALGTSCAHSDSRNGGYTDRSGAHSAADTRVCKRAIGCNWRDRARAVSREGTGRRSPSRGRRIEAVLRSQMRIGVRRAPSPCRRARGTALPPGGPRGTRSARSCDTVRRAVCGATGDRRGASGGRTRAPCRTAACTRAARPAWRTVPGRCVRSRGSACPHVRNTAGSPCPAVYI